MPALIPALIVGAGAVAGSAISASASGHANDVAANAAAQNDALQQQTYEQNAALIQPSVNRGNQAADELQGFLGLGDDSAKAQNALNTYLNSTGYQFEKQQGLNAVEQQESAEGLYNSGAAEKALDGYATGLAGQYGQQYAGDLNDVANRGANAINALTGAAINNANQQGADNNSAAALINNASLSSANATDALIAKAVNAYGMTRGQSSFGGADNAFAPGG